MRSVEDLKVFFSLRSDDLRDSHPRGSDEPLGKKGYLFRKEYFTS
jgi:hypothetical protein